MEALKKSALLGVVVLAVIGAASVFGNYLGNQALKDEPVITQQAKDNSFKNSFVSGCVQEGGAEISCACAYDELVALHPDFSTNEDRLNRILTEGYNLNETTAVSKCFTSEI